MRRIVVKVRWQAKLRLGEIFEDTTSHWTGVVTEPAMYAKGRSLQTIERELRRHFPEEEEISFVFELVQTPEGQKISEEARNAIDEAEKAAIAADAKIREAIRTLLLGDPAVTLRDAARILALDKSFVQRIVDADPDLSRSARKKSRAASRAASLKKQHPHFYETPAERRARWRPNVPQTGR